MLAQPSRSAQAHAATVAFFQCEVAERILTGLVQPLRRECRRFVLGHQADGFCRGERVDWCRKMEEQPHGTLRRARHRGCHMSPICAWPAAERPRERLLEHGTAALTDAELLAVVLGNGNAQGSALDVARELLANHRGLSGLLAEAPARLAATSGMGPSKAARLKAGVELARRMLREDMTYGDALTSPEKVRDYLKLSLASLPHEAFVVLFLDSQHRLLAADELFRGTLAH